MYAAVVVGHFSEDSERRVVTSVLEVAESKGENVINYVESVEELIESLKEACETAAAPTVAVIAHSSEDGKLVMSGFEVSQKRIYEELSACANFRLAIYSCYSECDEVLAHSVGQINHVTDFLNKIDKENASVERDRELDELSLGHNLGSPTIKEFARQVRFLRGVGKAFNNNEKRIDPSTEYSKMVEYDVPAEQASAAAGSTGANKHRVVAVIRGKKVVEVHYTGDHYNNFVKL